MNKSRVSMNEIMDKFEQDSLTAKVIVDEPSTAIFDPNHSDEVVVSLDISPESAASSLTKKLAKPQKKVTKIRFTLDLEKPLDDRLNKAAKLLNCHKSEIAREALKLALDKIEQERHQ